MGISIFLAKVIGFYIIIKLFIVWKNYSKLPSVIEGFKNNNALRLSFGLIMVVLGLLIVVSHNIWAWDYRVIITIIGWSTLIKGSLLSCSLTFLDKTAHFVSQRKTLYFISILSVILAIFLLSKGFNY